MKIAFIADGRINLLPSPDTPIRLLNCAIADTYREREREIRLKKEWKNQGAGAMFTGAFFPGQAILDVRALITGLSQGTDDRLIYALNFENSGGIYFKHPDPDKLETPIVSSANTCFYELDVNAEGRIVVSCAKHSLERHISLLTTTSGHLHIITEGECADANPKWSQKDEHILYYDSAGIGYGREGQFVGFGPRSIYRYNTKTQELDEILSGDAMEYCCPFEDKEGNLYFIRRPYKQNESGMSLVDFLKAPFKIIRAMGAWLDFFSRRYTGESLNTSGANPAKNSPKSPHQIFIDNNLFEAEKMIKQNAAAGDKNPGYIPRNWELIVKKPTGEEQVLHKSVMSYCITPDGIVYSNGKYIMQGTQAIAAELASKLVLYQ